MSANDDIRDQARRIDEASRALKDSATRARKREGRLFRATAELADIADAAGISVDVPTPKSGHDDLRHYRVPDDLAAAAGCLSAETLKRIDDEFLHSVTPVAPMDDLDHFVVISVGCLAALADFLLVGLPPGTRWTPTLRQPGGVPEGWLSERLKSWTVRNDNWLALLCHAPFDRPTIPGSDLGLNPANHRMLSFGHDPSPMGFVFGLMDIVSGNQTGVSINGLPFSISGVPPSWTRACLAPIVWLGHLVSDVATPMGIPVPATTVFGLLRVPIPGAPDNATLADLSRVLYLRGYDFRHYMVGGVVPGLIEGIIRLYDWLRYSAETDLSDPMSLQCAERYAASTSSNARLASRLFWAHAIAAGANSGKIAIQGLATRDFFSAVSCLNLAEWQVFAVRTIGYIRARVRDTDLEQALANRKRLNHGWDALLRDGGCRFSLYEALAESIDDGSPCEPKRPWPDLTN